MAVAVAMAVTAKAARGGIFWAAKAQSRSRNG